MLGITEEHTTRDMVFRFLVAYKREHDGNSPSTRDIAVACHLSSLTTVRHHLLVLDREGRIRLSDDSRYQIEIFGASWEYESQEVRVSDEPDDQEGQTDSSTRDPFGARQ